MQKILIVEDFPDDAELLRENLERYAQKHGLDFRIEWSENARALASGTRAFDLIFLDIELPGVSGMDAATLMRSYDSATPVIFTTSLSQYAVKSYEVDAAGFIVKPVTMPKLEMALDKMAEHLRRGRGKRIVLSTSGGIRVISTTEIAYVELIRHDLTYHLGGEPEPIKQRGTIKQFVDEVSCEPFLQVSSGCVVNMDYIELIRGSEVTLRGGAVLPLSRARRKASLEAFAAYMGSAL